MAFKVLQLGQFPLNRRISGGQRRAGAIHDAYRRNNVDVAYAAIFARGSYPEAVRTAGSFVVGESTERAVATAPLLLDVTIGESFDRDRACVEPLLQFWNRFNPDAIQIEHCFLWPGIKRLLETGRVRSVPVIYSSHNHETAMKSAIYERFLTGETRKAAVAKVRWAEEDLTRHAEIVVTVSEGDAEAARSMGARHCEVVRNGGERAAATSLALRHWKEKLRADRVQSFVLFVSSNHLPNYVGFQQLVGTFLSYLPPNACIVAAGGICRFIDEQSAFRPEMLLNRSRLRLLGQGLGDGDLAALMRLARAILLPITDGGGSNIKTVEALLSGRPIIATPFAFRSYEEFQALPRIRLCDEASSFQSAIQKAVIGPDVGSVEPEPHLESVTWPKLGDQFARLMIEHFQPLQESLKLALKYCDRSATIFRG